MSFREPGRSPRGTRPPVQPGFAGIATFLRAGQATVDALPVGAVGVSGIPLDGVADTPGTADGPRAIREASVAFLASLLPSMRGALVEVDTARRVEFADDLPLVDLGDVDPLVGPATVAETLATHAAAVAARAGVAVFLGGTRAITLPLLDGVARVRGRCPALLRVGANLDLADELSDRPLAPGAALRGVARRGTTAACLGVQGWQPAVEWLRTTETGLAATPLADWRRQGLATTARTAAQALLRGADELYVSIDIRVADAGFAAGRGRVLSGGLLPAELLEVADALAPFPVGTIDLVEVAPGLDSTGRTEHLAFRTLLALLLPRLTGMKAA
jgi:arginase family enzyme